MQEALSLQVLCQWQTTFFLGPLFDPLYIRPSFRPFLKLKNPKVTLIEHSRASWWNSNPFWCVNFGNSSKFQTVTKNVTKTWQSHVTWLALSPMASWLNSTPFWCVTLNISSKLQTVTKNVTKTWQSHVTWLALSPMASWLNSTPFWCITLGFSSKLTLLVGSPHSWIPPNWIPPGEWGYVRLG